MWLSDPATNASNALRLAKSVFLGYLTKEYEFIAFVDGAWKKKYENKAKGGIGGFIMLGDMRQKFVFSGPSHRINSQLVEIEAFVFACQVCQKYWPGRKCIICSDAKKVVESFTKSKCGIQNSQVDLDFSWFNIDFTDIWACSINRAWNLEADHLAKMGILGPN